VNILAYLTFLRDNGFIWNQSRERPGQPLSNSEIRRWIANGSVLVNGERPRLIECEVETPVRQLVLFPGGKGQVSLV